MLLFIYGNSSLIRYTYHNKLVILPTTVSFKIVRLILKMPGDQQVGQIAKIKRNIPGTMCAHCGYIRLYVD
jgi:hypothetical protein